MLVYIPHTIYSVAVIVIRSWQYLTLFWEDIHEGCTHRKQTEVLFKSSQLEFMAAVKSDYPKHS